MSKTKPLKELFKNFDDAFYLLEEQSFLAIEGLEQQLQQAQDEIKELEICLEDITRVAVSPSVSMHITQISILQEMAQQGLDGGDCFKSVVSEIKEQQAIIKLLAERIIRVGRFIGDTTDSATYAAELVEFGGRYK